MGGRTSKPEQMPKNSASASRIPARPFDSQELGRSGSSKRSTPRRQQTSGNLSPQRAAAYSTDTPARKSAARVRQILGEDGDFGDDDGEEEEETIEGSSADNGAGAGGGGNKSYVTKGKRGGGRYADHAQPDEIQGEGGMEGEDALELSGVCTQFGRERKKD